MSAAHQKFIQTKVCSLHRYCYSNVRRHVLLPNSWLELRVQLFVEFDLNKASEQILPQIRDNSTLIRNFIVFFAFGRSALHERHNFTLSLSLDESLDSITCIAHLRFTMTVALSPNFPLLNRLKNFSACFFRHCHTLKKIIRIDVLGIGRVAFFYRPIFFSRSNLL